MDSSEIKQLLEKYWNCETSLAEEQQLKEYFRSNTVPESLKETSELFRYFETQKKESLTQDFDGEVMKQIAAERPKGKVVKMMFNVARIAAGLVVVVAATYFVRQEIRKSYPPEIADTYSDPKLAFEETKKALMMISKGFGKAQKEARKINLLNEAEQKVQGREENKKESSII